MVKPILFCLTLLLTASCNELSKPVHEEEVFDTKGYRLNIYTERVHTFLKSRNETKDKKEYLAVFMNTRLCSACTRGNFDEIAPYLSHVRTKTFIYINDSTIENGLLKNKQIQFIYLPEKVYKSQHIFHDNIYLYPVHNDNIRPIELTRAAIDSLNQVAG